MREVDLGKGGRLDQPGGCPSRTGNGPLPHHIRPAAFVGVRRRLERLGEGPRQRPRARPAAPSRASVASIPRTIGTQAGIANAATSGPEVDHKTSATVGSAISATTQLHPQHEGDAPAGPKRPCASANGMRSTKPASPPSRKRVPPTARSTPESGSVPISTSPTKQASAVQRHPEFSLRVASGFGYTEPQAGQMAPAGPVVLWHPGHRCSPWPGPASDPSCTTTPCSGRSCVPQFGQNDASCSTPTPQAGQKLAMSRGHVTGRERASKCT
jgi:hypothetical protein